MVTSHVCSKHREHVDLVAGPSFYWRQYIDSISRNGLGLAVLSAWGLRWNCLCEDFQTEFRCLSTGCSDLSPLGRVQHEYDFATPCISQTNEILFEKGTVCSVAALSAGRPSLLHGDGSPTVSASVFDSAELVSFFLQAIDSLFEKI